MTKPDNGTNDKFYTDIKHILHVLFHIPTWKRFESWSIPNRVTYLSFWLTVIGLIWTVFTFFYTPSDSRESLKNTIEASGEIRIPKLYWLEYIEAREVLIEEGWMPVRQHWRKFAGVKSGYHYETWQKFPEAYHCWPTSTGDCIFLFASPSGKNLQVETTGLNHLVEKVFLKDE